jgi:hypothetical protein
MTNSPELLFIDSVGIKCCQKVEIKFNGDQFLDLDGFAEQNSVSLE